MSTMERDPAVHHAVRRLAAKDAAEAATAISRLTDRPWIRQACEGWLRGEAWATVQVLGVYGLRDAHGEGVPTLLVDVATTQRSKVLPARAAVVGLFYADAGLTATCWTREPDGPPGSLGIRGPRLG